MKQLQSFRGSRFILVCIFVITASWAILSSPAEAQYQCVQELAKAEKLHAEGQFDEALQRIRTCLSKGGLSKTDSVQAFLLLAKIQHAQDEYKKAEEGLRIVLRLSPEWRPNPNDKPSFIKFAHEVIITHEVTKKWQKEHQKSKSKKWLWIGAGTAVVGGGMIVALLGKDNRMITSTDKLPDPPGSPSGN